MLQFYNFQCNSKIVDTGARVNVMDVSTMRDLGLEEKLVPSTGRVFAVCNAPIQVLGYLDVSIKVPGESANTMRIQILEGKDQALLLGRQFMQQFGCVMFDPQSPNICKGNGR